MLLDYSRYADLGGSVSLEAFPSLELQAELLLDEWCSGRLKNSAPSEQIDIALYMIIEFLKDEDGEQVTSFSNGVNSFGFELSTRYDLYDKVVSILPVELVSLAVD